MEKAKLNNEHIATVAGDIAVFNYDGDTREYLSSSFEYLPVGIGIPANSCVDAPGESKVGLAICRREDFTSWEYVADHRGEKVYSTKSGEAVIVALPGNYPEGTTTQAPYTLYDKWNGTEWVTDTKAQHAANVEATKQQKTALLIEAQATINIWQTELQLGIISNEDKASLIAWMKYIKAVKVLNTSTAPDVNWPEKPAV
ncbi:Tail fiber assembly protein from lambdoid prophage e14 [Beauveria bassiana D1-5]|uniref:Tail fiber assembly protein from lambdoid prophage e14 n=1 Tax=Beauveria bassiana D1-5 TaxID=1245745 RepID=A0A0A2W0N3_BEABA|nr:Tail fiber assembly protein from lambdoid prophage e14 [Beauveria bassiana D1-5]